MASWLLASKQPDFRSSHYVIGQLSMSVFEKKSVAPLATYFRSAVNSYDKTCVVRGSSLIYRDLAHLPVCMIEYWAFTFWNPLSTWTQTFEVRPSTVSNGIRSYPEIIDTPLGAVLTQLSAKTLNWMTQDDWELVKALIQL